MTHPAKPLKNPGESVKSRVIFGEVEFAGKSTHRLCCGFEHADRFSPRILILGSPQMPVNYGFGAVEALVVACRCRNEMDTLTACRGESS